MYAVSVRGQAESVLWERHGRNDNEGTGKRKGKKKKDKFTSGSIQPEDLVIQQRAAADTRAFWHLMGLFAEAKIWN